MSPVSDGADESEITAELARAWLIDRAWHDLGERSWRWLAEQDADTSTLRDDAEARRCTWGTFWAAQGMTPEEIDEIVRDQVLARRTWLAYWLGEKGYEADQVMVYEDNQLSSAEKELAHELAREVCLRSLAAG